MSSTTAPDPSSSSEYSPSSSPTSFAPATISTKNVEGRVVIICGSAIAICIILIALCVVLRIRMVRRRRAALGLPLSPVLERRLTMKEDLEEWKERPETYEIWSNLASGFDHRSPPWKELHPTSSSRILSDPAPSKPKEKHNLFKTNAASIMQMISVERLDKALMESATLRKEEPSPEYTKSQLAAVVAIAMPRPNNYNQAEGEMPFPDIEFGVYYATSRDL
ncbi:hypothetical protein FRB90_008642 [Tulasnella sp. 427]|nr:hypothetical protein FRB90_008642 [Tulasnella sp. 427]